MVEYAADLCARYGFTTLKYKNGVLPPDQEIETFVRLREAFPNHRLRLDPNAAWSINTAIRVARKLHDYDVEYLEDPVWGFRAMQRVNKKTPWVSLASNMSIFGFEDLAPAIVSDVLDVVLLDPHWYGGMQRAKLAGQICEAMGVDVGMHSGAELGISQMAMVHLAASLPNLTLAPDSHYHHLTDDIIEGGKLQYHNGCMRVSSAPGLGVSLDRDKLAHYFRLAAKQEMGSWIEDPMRPGMITHQPKW
jgi:glucarate dehydratase